MAEREIYKGIEFIRISKLPQDQRDRILASFPKEKIIKILHDEVILKDCIQYLDYQEWFRKDQPVSKIVPSDASASVRTTSLQLAHK